MSLSVRYSPEAFADVAEAFSWYQAQRPGLGWEFATELDAAIGLLERAPEAGPVVHRSLRRALLRRFPYAVYYAVAAEHILVGSAGVVRLAGGSPAAQARFVRQR